MRKWYGLWGEIASSSRLLLPGLDELFSNGKRID